jgi:hypothetical protein
MSSDRAGEVVNAMVAMFSTGDLSEIETTVHPDYLDHQGLQGEPVHGPGGFSTVVAAARCGYDSLDVTVEDLIRGPDRAAARLLWSGIRSSGDAMSRQTLEIIRIDAGKAIEHWGARS